MPPRSLPAPPTLTCSPAIAACAAQPEVTVDLEGITRPQGAACDLGAYEFKVKTK